MNLLWFWVVYVIVFLAAHYWIYRRNKRKTDEMFAAHNAAMDRIWAAHRVRMDELFAKYREHRK